jgi:hypothetical protein
MRDNTGEAPFPTRIDRAVLRLGRTDLPLMVEYDDKRYVLVLTSSNKLLLQKPLLPEPTSQGA